jgi:pimeloyl-ACP methyl ester carboxylesterase
VHQPEVARLARLLVALVLVLPLVDTGRSMVVSGAFLTEFLAAPVWRPLTWLTDAPVRTTMTVPGAAVDRYARPSPPVGTPLVLVHGVAPDGKDDPLLAAAAALLARAGFDVAVPTVSGLTEMRLRPADREPVIATIGARAQPTVMIGVSVGAGVALLAAADERVRDRVALVLSLGGYGSARALVRYYLTGEYEGEGVRGRRVHDPALVRMFVDANVDLLDASTPGLLSGNAAEVTRALSALSPDLMHLFDALSPVRVLDRVRADLVLVHGRDDIAVPFTESLALRGARPERSRLVLVGVVGHVEAAPKISIVTSAHDLAALWSVVYALVTRA